MIQSSSNARPPRHQHPLRATQAKPSASVLDYFAQRATEQRRISTVSIAEIRFGISIANDPVKREDIRLWLIEVLLPLFEGQILEVTEAILLRWRILIEAGRKAAGRTYAQPDLLLAATALEYDLILVTRNTKDFTIIPGLNSSTPGSRNEERVPAC